MGIERDLYKDSNVDKIVHRVTNVTQPQNNACWKHTAFYDK